MTTQLSRKDGLVTLALLFACFVALPFVLWKYSTWRTEAAVTRASSAIEQAILLAPPDAHAFFSILSAEMIVPTKEPMGRFHKSQDFVAKACEDLFSTFREGEFSKKYNLNTDRPASCLFYYIDDNGRYLHVQEHGWSYSSISEDYRNEVQGLVDRAKNGEAFPMYIRPDNSRGVRTTVILSQDPTMVWDFGMMTNDRAY